MQYLSFSFSLVYSSAGSKPEQAEYVSHTVPAVCSKTISCPSGVQESVKIYH